MKIVLIIALAFAIAAEAAREKRQTGVSSFTYPAGSTAAYTPGTGLIYNSGTIVKYVAGTTVIFPSRYITELSFEGEAWFFTKEGPVYVNAGYNATFGSNAQVTFAPGATVKFTTNLAEVLYQQFNGNTHTMVQYPSQTQAKYYCSNCNLILMSGSTNPLQYYNPGGTTKFGPSALPVEIETTPTATARTYGYYGGGGGYSYCSGYSYNGYPQTTYVNYNTGYRSTCYQTGYNTYSYGGGGGGYSTGGGGSGGYSMAGGSCYGGGSYYGGGGGYGR